MTVIQGRKIDDAKHFLSKCLPSFNAEVLPPPSTDSKVMQNITDQRYQSKISPDFIEQVKIVVQKIFELCHAKKDSTGNITGKSIYNL